MPNNTCKWKPKYLPEYKCHEPPLSGDPNGYCILHSEKEDKDIAEFTKKVDERMAAPDGIDLVGCYFPGKFRSDYFSRRKFDKPVDFRQATFSHEANFGWATFSQETDFSGATFSQDVNFSRTVFSDTADFSGVKFSQEARFGWAKFSQGTFSGAIFSQVAYFFEATFLQAASFIKTKFLQATDFREATFLEEVNFNWAVFSQEADFSRATFSQMAYFNETTFSKAYFSGTTFKRRTVFDFAEFKERALFIPLGKEQEKTNVKFGPGSSFQYARFLGDVRFQDVDLSNCSFLHANIDKVDFRYCNFGEKKPLLPIFSPRQNVLWDERDADKGKVDYEHVRRLYLELKRNFEDKKDWDRAGDFYYGEMECRRKMKWWLCRWLFSLEAIYFLLSGYGERPLRAGLWVAALIFGLAFLHPLPAKPARDEALLPQAVSEVRERLDRTRETLDRILPRLLSRQEEKEIEPAVKPPEEVVAEEPVPLYEKYTTRLRKIWCSQWARDYREKFKCSLRATVRLDTGEKGWVNTVQGILGPIFIALFALALRRKVKR